MTQIVCICFEGEVQPDALHRIDCLTVAATQPGTMINDDGEVFYPDDDEDAAYFAEHHSAYLLVPDEGTAA